MAYTVLFKPSAQKTLSKLSEQLQKRIVKKAMALAGNPRPMGSEKLSGYENRYRIRVGDYRVVYMIEDDRLIVTIIDLGHRREIYRGA